MTTPEPPYVRDLRASVAALPVQAEVVAEGKVEPPKCPEFWVLLILRKGLWRLDDWNTGDRAEEITRNWGQTQIEEGNATAYRVVRVPGQEDKR